MILHPINEKSPWPSYSASFYEGKTANEALHQKFTIES